VKITTGLHHWTVRIISTDAKGTESTAYWAGAAETVNAAVDDALVENGYFQHKQPAWLTLVATRGEALS